MDNCFYEILSKRVILKGEIVNVDKRKEADFSRRSDRAFKR
ncbi:hypothetical protein J2W97_001192 [Paenibacillus jamilae]|nr:hypothetical protein [Paenibacillus jamilae]